MTTENLSTEQRLHLIAELNQYDHTEAISELLKLAADTGLPLDTLRHAANHKNMVFTDDAVGVAA